VATETKTRSVRIPAAYVKLLDALARQRGCSRDDVLSDALTVCFEVHESHIKGIQEAIDEIDAGTPMIPHEEVVAWLRSWGTPNELPPPR
jgi:predicted transcriptional regulator